MKECPSLAWLQQAADSPMMRDDPIYRSHVARCARCRRWECRLAEAGQELHALRAMLAGTGHDPVRATAHPTVSNGYDSGDSGDRVVGDARPLGSASDGDGAVAGTRVGQYTIECVLGSGGMGVVYRAVQDRTGQRVALKIAHRWRNAPEAVQRFRREARVLGRLQHPLIARVFEAGAVGTGLHTTPFVAMEYIDGQPLHEAARALDWPARLELIAALCDAVQHAHDHGVVHRDLKPANVLVERVDGRSRPRVLDFGVARLLHDIDGEATLETAAGRLIGTVAYMSPEQCGGYGGVVDARTDIYALGVITYELLAGKLPYQVNARDLPAAVRTICTAEPVSLSSVNRRYRSAVAPVVARMLEKDPGRRYAQAAEVAADLRAILSGAPVSVRPMRLVERFQRFVGRQRYALAMGVVAAIALTASWMAVRQAGFLRAVYHQLDEEVTRFRPTDGVGGLWPWLNDSGEAASTGLPPQLALMVHRCLAWNYIKAGHFADARSSLASAFEAQATIGRPDDRWNWLELVVLYGNMLALTDRHEEAVDVLRIGLEKGEAAWGTSDLVTAQLRRVLARRLIDIGRFDEARRMLDRSWADLSVDPAVDPDALLGVLRARANLECRADRPRAALQWTARALKGNPWPVGRERAALLEIEAYALSRLGDWSAARERWAALLAMEEMTPTNPGRKSVCLRSLAQCDMREGAFERARERLDQAADELRSRGLHEGPWIATILRFQAGLHWTVGRYAEAERLFRELLADGGPGAALGRTTVLNSLGVVLRDAGEFVEAEACLANALVALRQRFGDTHSTVANTRINLARLYLMTGRIAEAEYQACLAQEIRRTMPSIDSPEQAELALVLGMVDVARGRPIAARVHLKSAFEARTRIYGPEHHLTAEARMALATSVIEQDPSTATAQLVAARIALERSQLLPEHRLFDILEEAEEAVAQRTARVDSPSVSPEARSGHPAR